ncbi:MAG TPA: 4'-phosphopantetheinyl transferase superfamily protein [Acidimicrobiia bacterium]|nr:4'-phosphopantetheinyl transferase superfamily protein [Acidimicrobiia bacterium]
MTRSGLLEGRAHDVPWGDEWLAPEEQAVQAGLAVAKRRDDWRLGRWVAKRTVAAAVDLCLATPQDASRIAVVAAADGAPEVSIDGFPAPLRLSISHRAGRGAAAVCDEGVALGLDLELVEARSPAFVREWLAPPEQTLVDSHPEPALVANLVWAAKEASAKACREGLRLPVRRLVVEPVLDPADSGWQPVAVRFESRVLHGWWRADDGFVLVVVTEPASKPPARL